MDSANRFSASPIALDVSSGNSMTMSPDSLFISEPTVFDVARYILEKLGRENCFIADGEVEILSFPIEDRETDITYYTVQ